MLIFFVFLGFLIWGIKSGQFKNVEEAKYIIFKTPEREKKNSEKTHSDSTLKEGGTKDVDRPQ